MKIRIAYEDLPALHIEGDPADCARFVRALQTQSPVAAPSTPHAAEAKEPRADAGARPSQPKGATPAEPAKKAEPKAQKPSRRLSSRRTRVLKVIHRLHQEDQERVTLKAIVEAYQRMFPSEPVQHLDQVVRDLANKTDLLEHVGRGAFRLVDPAGSAEPYLH